MSDQITIWDKYANEPIRSSLNQEAQNGVYIESVSYSGTEDLKTKTEENKKTSALAIGHSSHEESVQS